MTDISKFRNCDVEITGDELFDIFIYEFILSFVKNY